MRPLSIDLRRKDARSSAAALAESETLADDMKNCLGTLVGVEEDLQGLGRISIEQWWTAVENGGYQ